jgi:sporulation protein YlmC with PRC-barrel domain
VGASLGRLIYPAWASILKAELGVTGRLLGDLCCVQTSEERPWDRMPAGGAQPSQVDRGGATTDRGSVPAATNSGGDGSRHPLRRIYVAELENLREWEGKEVLDSNQEKIGRLEDVYFDSETDQPMFITVHTGLFGSRLTFIPTENASLGQDYVEVARPKAATHNAPHIEKGGELSPEEEAKLFKFYGLDYAPGSNESGRRLVRR